MDKIKVLDKIRKEIGDFYITGSLSLLESGVINRKTGDIDIAITDKKKFQSLIEEYECLIFCDYLVDWEAEGRKSVKASVNKAAYIANLTKKERINLAIEEKVNQIQLHVDGVKVDVFYIEKVENPQNINLLGKIYQATPPEISIEAKRRIVQNLSKIKNPTQKQVASKKKHLEDISSYNSWVIVHNTKQ